LGYTAPEYDHLEVKDSIALVYFKGEIAEATEDELDGCFKVAGENRGFYPARASVGEWKDFAKVYSDKVKHPVAVRYCFRNWCKGKLFGTNELPVSSFRTDDWDE
jgi:sialate O-acetylesterase